MQRNDINDNNSNDEFALQAELQKIMASTKGGFAAATTLSAMAAVFKQHADVFVPSLTALTGEAACLPVKELGEQGVKFIALLVEIKQEHQAAVWVNIQDETVTVIDSLNNPSLPKEAAARLMQLLGIDQSHFTFAAPTAEQTDNWSCGVHVITNLLLQYHGEMDQSPLIERAERYLRLAQEYDKAQEQQHERDEAQKRRTRGLLYQIERFRLDSAKTCDPESKFFMDPRLKHAGMTDFTDASDFLRPLSDHLQLLVWGNLDRQSTPENNDDRKDESNAVLLARPLRTVCDVYAEAHKGDKVGLLILKLAALYEEQAPTELTTAIETVISTLNKQLPIRLTAVDYYSEELKAYRNAVSTLSSEMTLDDQRTQLTIFQLIKQCLALKAEHENNSEFLRHCIHLITQDAEQTEFYLNQVMSSVEKTDSLLLDLLWFMIDDYEKLQNSKLYTERSNAPIWAAIQKRNENENHARREVFALLGLTDESCQSTPITGLYSKLALIKSMYEHHVFQGLDNNSIIKFLLKLVSGHGYVTNFINVITHYPRHEHADIEKYLISAIQYLEEVDILTAQVFGGSLVDYALDAELLEFARAIVKRAGKLLINAIVRDNSEEANKLIDLGANVNVVNRKNITALMLAITNGNLAIVKRLLAHPDTTMQNADAESYLIAAAQHGMIAIMRELQHYIAKHLDMPPVSDLDQQMMDLLEEHYVDNDSFISALHDLYVNNSELFFALIEKVKDRASLYLSLHPLKTPEDEIRYLDLAWPPAEYNHWQLMSAHSNISQANKKHFVARTIKVFKTVKDLIQSYNILTKSYSDQEKYTYLREFDALVINIDSLCRMLEMLPLSIIKTEIENYLEKHNKFTLNYTQLIRLISILHDLNVDKAVIEKVITKHFNLIEKIDGFRNIEKAIKSHLSPALYALYIAKHKHDSNFHLPTLLIRLPVQHWETLLLENADAISSTEEGDYFRLYVPSLPAMNKTAHIPPYLPQAIDPVETLCNHLYAMFDYLRIGYLVALIMRQFANFKVHTINDLSKFSYLLRNQDQLLVIMSILIPSLFKSSQNHKCGISPLCAALMFKKIDPWYSYNELTLNICFDPIFEEVDFALLRSFVESYCQANFSKEAVTIFLGEPRSKMVTEEMFAMIQSGKLPVMLVKALPPKSFDLLISPAALHAINTGLITAHAIDTPEKDFLALIAPENAVAPLVKSPTSPRFFDKPTQKPEPAQELKVARITLHRSGVF